MLTNISRYRNVKKFSAILGRDDLYSVSVVSQKIVTKVKQ